MLWQDVDFERSKIQILRAKTKKTFVVDIYPQRDPVDIDVTFDKAITEGARDNHWKHICRKFNSWYKPPTKLQAPAVIIAKRQFTPAPRPAVRSSCESRPIGGKWFDGLSSEEWHAKDNGWYGLGGRDNWIKAERPHLALRSQAERELIVTELAAKHNLKIC